MVITAELDNTVGNTPSSVVSYQTTAIEYYPWEDGVSTVFFVLSFQDYDRLCHILVNQLNTSSSGYTLTLNANRGGLGHKQVSFMLGISYALLLGRRLQSGVGCER